MSLTAIAWGMTVSRAPGDPCDALIREQSRDRDEQAEEIAALQTAVAELRERIEKSERPGGGTVGTRPSPEFR